MREYLKGGVFLCLSAYAHAPMVIFNRLIPSKHTRRFTAIFSDVLKTLAFSITNPIFSHIFTLGRSLAFVSYRIVRQNPHLQPRMCLFHYMSRLGLDALMTYGPRKLARICGGRRPDFLSGSVSDCLDQSTKHRSFFKEKDEHQASALNSSTTMNVRVE